MTVLGVHENSIESLALCDEATQEARVLAAYEVGQVWTDRQVLNRLRLRDMNEVRPSITKLVERGLLVEVGTVRCSTTKRQVRQCRRLAPDEVPRPIVARDEDRRASLASAIVTRGFVVLMGGRKVYARRGWDGPWLSFQARPGDQWDVRDAEGPLNAADGEAGALAAVQKWLGA